MRFGKCSYFNYFAIGATPAGEGSQVVLDQVQRGLAHVCFSSFWEGGLLPSIQGARRPFPVIIVQSEQGSMFRPEWVGLPEPCNAEDHQD